jgi:hypothetical protein
MRLQWEVAKTDFLIMLGVLNASEDFFLQVFHKGAEIMPE